MSRSIAILAGAAIAAVALSGAASAQVAPQPVPQTVTPAPSQLRVDPLSLTSGFRVSKIVGSSVINAANETIGTIDDLIISPNEKVPFAVLSVGGFLGLGTKTVTMPYSSMEIQEGRMVLRDATKESLKTLPEYSAAPNDRTTSKIIGSAVVNSANETVGTVDDLIITPNEKLPFAVLSVGGFLGLGSRLVVVPYGSLEMRDQRLTLRDATKDSVRSLPEYRYN